MGREIVFGETGARLEFEESAGAKGLAIICPGGGYEFVSERESKPVARRFAGAGWQPLILNYSVGFELGKKPLREAAWAVRTARRTFADSPGPPPFTVLCGFSAGGHLAASLGVHWDDETEFPDPGERRAQRPDGLILAYPVISGGPRRHADSFSRLRAGDGDLGYFSLENHVTSATPPAFIWHTAADELVPVENSLVFAGALGARGVPFELHVYPFGAHGLSLATPEVEQPEKGRFSDPRVAGWFELSLAWLDLALKRKREGE
ncbi:MAG: alpha/beta hydrolase [Planctomycetota bacterium]|jgi:acetyl esterase/lipase|nr:alpha/beta hydrolase [Planctomycetota bacterium]